MTVFVRHNLGSCIFLHAVDFFHTSLSAGQKSSFEITFPESEDPQDAEAEIEVRIPKPVCSLLLSSLELSDTKLYEP